MNLEEIYVFWMESFGTGTGRIINFWKWLWSWY